MVTKRNLILKADVVGEPLGLYWRRLYSVFDSLGTWNTDMENMTEKALNSALKNIFIFQRLHLTCQFIHTLLRLL